MKTSTFLLLGAGAYALYYLGNVGVATNTIQVIFSGVNIKSLTDYVVTMTVQNISNASLTVNAMSGNLLLNGNQVASMSDFTPRVIPAAGQVNIDIEITPNLLDIPSAIQNLIQTPGQNLVFTAVGNVNVSGLVLPFNLDKTITL
jgi:LEA14-like dessication related protein